jgi:[ribosomal protein S18]-alanine N-acetyltransferase
MTELPIVSQSAIIIERTSSADDLEAVAALEEATFTNPWTLEMLTRELARPEVGRLYVLRLPRIPVAAFCACWTVADELHINTIAVTAELRGQGLGTRLMEYVLRETSQEGFRRATLEVRRSNEAAQRLYSRLGFAVAAIRPGYYTQPDEDALILWREAAVPARTPADPDTADPEP